MKVFRRLALAMIGAALWTSLALAAAPPPVCDGRDLTADPAVKPDYAAFADDLVNDEGLLWKIEKPGVAPSFLYGTVHSTQAAPIALMREAARHLDEAKIVVTELGGPFDASDKVNMSAAMLSASLSADVDTFSGELSGADADVVERYLADHGYPKEMVHHLKLWFLAVGATMPRCETEGKTADLPEVDETIAALGKASGLPVKGLETLQEQIDAIAATPPGLAARMLIATARRPDLEDDSYVTLLKLYTDKRPTRALAVVDAVPGVSVEDRAAEREFTKLLLVGRNEVMASRAAPYLASGGAFIAVGALHLSGKAGLVERFRAIGYRVTKIW